MYSKKTLNQKMFIAFILPGLIRSGKVRRKGFFINPIIRAGETILNVGGKYIVSKEGPSWLGPTGQKIFWKIDLSDWLKHTLNQVYTLK